MNWGPLEPPKAELLRTFFRVSNLLNKHYLIFTTLPHVTKYLRMVVYTWWVGQLPYKCPLRRCAFYSQMGRLHSIKPHQSVDLVNSQTNSPNWLTTRWLLYTILANGELPDIARLLVFKEYVMALQTGDVCKCGVESILVITHEFSLSPRRVAQSM